MTPAAVGCYTYVDSLKAGTKDPALATTAPGAASETALVSAVPVATLDLTKVADQADLVAGGAMSYDLTVTNTGTVASSNTVVSDTLNGAYTFVSDSASACTAAGTPQVLTCALGPVAAGAKVTDTIKVTVAAPIPAADLDASGDVDNTAVLTAPGSNCADPTQDATNCMSSVVTPVLTLATQISASTVTLGQSLSDVITVAGGADSTATGTSTLLGPLTPGPGGSCASLNWTGAPTAGTAPFSIVLNGAGTGTDTSADTAVTPAAVGCYTYVDSLKAGTKDPALATTARGSQRDRTGQCRPGRHLGPDQGGRPGRPGRRWCHVL